MLGAAGNTFSPYDSRSEERRTNTGVAPTGKRTVGGKRRRILTPYVYGFMLDTFGLISMEKV